MEKELASILKTVGSDSPQLISVLTPLLENIHKHYPEGAAKSFYEPNAQVHAQIPMAGGNPITLVQAYKKPDHHCYVTFFLASKVGYEMTFRIGAAEKTRIKDEHVNLLANLVNKTLFEDFRYDREEFALLYWPEWFGQGAKLSTTRAFLFLKDPILGSVETPIGTIHYIHCFGLNTFEFRFLFDRSRGDNWAIQSEARRFVDTVLKVKPELITELRRDDLRWFD